MPDCFFMRFSRGGPLDQGWLVEDRMESGPPTEERVEAEIARVLRESLHWDSPIRPEQDLEKDLQLDSITLITLVVELETVFHVQLREEDAGTVHTVQELARLVVRRVAESTTGDAP